MQSYSSNMFIRICLPDDFHAVDVHLVVISRSYELADTPHPIISEFPEYSVRAVDFSNLST